MDTDLDLNTTSSTNLLLADKSLEEIYQVYNRKVYGYFRRNGFDHEAAEDLTQEVFCRLLRFKDTFESNDQIRNWIFKVARNLLIDVLRKKENGSAKPILMEDLPSFDTLIMDHIHVEGPEQTFVTEESNGEVLSLIEELSPRYADVIRLRELDGLKYQEIAKELGMTAKAVEGLLHRARAKLKSNYTAFLKNYHGLLVGLGFIPRLLKRGTTATARVAWKGIEITSSKTVALGESLGAISFISGTRLISGLLPVLVAGGITAGSVALVQSKPAGTERGAQVAVGESAVPVPLGETLLGETLLGETLSLQKSVGLPSASVTTLGTQGPVALPLVTEVLGLLDGQVPTINPQGAVSSVVSQANAGLDQLYGVVDTLLSGITGLVRGVLSLLGAVPGLNSLTAGLVAGLPGISTEPLRNLQDQVLAGVQAVADPVLGVIDNVINQVTATMQNILSPIGGLTGGLAGGLTGGTTGGLAGGTPAVVAPQPAAVTPLAPANTPAPMLAPPADPNPGLLPGIHIPILSGLLLI